MRSVLLMSVAALVTCGALMTSAPAQQICGPNGCAPNLPVQPLVKELSTIEGGAYKQSGTWRKMPEEQRLKEWPLGDPSIQSCPFCLEPNEQNVARLKALEKK
jgi:hypothetical protein